jgi:NADH dehydrogenase
MKIAITGGSGFIGRHLARALENEGHEVVIISRNASKPFVRSDLSSAAELARAFAGCAAVAHCAGINREIGSQTYRKVHVQGTANVVEAAKLAGVSKVVLLSFLRARPGSGSGYHESKWAAEEIVRSSGLDYTILKASMTYGRGDHMLDHLSHALHTLPVFATVGLREKPVRPLAVDDLVTVLRASLVDGRLSGQTVAITGAEEMLLSEAVRRVGGVLGKRVSVIRTPKWSQYALAWVFERTMKVPLVAIAQVRILAEGGTEPAAGCDPLPIDLAPRRRFTAEQIRAGLPEPGRFGVRDLRCCAWPGQA